MGAQQLQQDYSTPAQLTNDQFLRWSQTGDNTNYADPYNMNSFAGNSMTGQQYQQPVPASSTQLARRPMNRQMVPTASRATFDNPNDPWGPFGDDGLLDPQNPNGVEETDNIELLEEKAVIAKRDAQSKRKQIPPFVQKLSR
jgi:heat shock transcription factor, other eukaryote